MHFTPSGADMINFMSGISDEAGTDLNSQMSAHQQLGWRYIELRHIDGQPVDTLEGAAAVRVAQQIADSGLQVNCLASRLGNWQRHIDTERNTEQAELHRLADFSQLTGNRYIRIMSYLNNGHSPGVWRDRVIERVAWLTEIAREKGVILLHENCSGWAGISAENSRYLLDSINSPHLKLMLDLGNGLTYQNSPDEFIRLNSPHIMHVHIKDGVRNADGSVSYTLPGQGEANLKSSLKSLHQAGYRGLYSIEPHLELIVHEGKRALSHHGINQSYLHYGQCALALLKQTLPSSEEIL